MIVTKSNSKFISEAVSRVAGVSAYSVVWSVDSAYNLQVDNPTGVDLSLVEAEAPLVEAAADIEALRSQRDELLAATDWWVLPDRTATQAQLDYRQALRDMTENYSSLADAVWPEKPEA